MRLRPGAGTRRNTLSAGDKVTVYGEYNNFWYVKTERAAAYGETWVFVEKGKVEPALKVVWPTPTYNGTYSNVISSRWGYRVITNPPRDNFHWGIDIGCGTGTEVVAAMTGEIDFSDVANGYGRTIIMRHPNYHNYHTRYAHLNSYTLREGERTKDGSTTIQAGIEIARSGTSGTENGVLKDGVYSPHLHFEVWRSANRSTSINPINVYHRTDIRSNDTNPNPFYVQSGGKYVFNTNYNWTKADDRWNGTSDKVGSDNPWRR